MTENKITASSRVKRMARITLTIVLPVVLNESKILTVTRIGMYFACKKKLTITPDANCGLKLYHNSKL